MEAAEGRPIRVVIVDDHEVLRLGLRTTLARSTSVRVTGEAASVAEALEVIQRDPPDVVLMDVRLPDGSGVAACRDIRSRFPGTRVLFLSSYTDEEAVVGAVFGGAAGYLLKDVSRDALVEAIQKVAAGHSVLDSSVTQDVLEHMRELARCPSPPEPGIQALSVQEHRVLELLAEGLSNKEIATALRLTEKTVRNYLYRLYKKIRVKRRSQATRLFLKYKGA